MVKELREITEDDFLNTSDFDLACKFGYHPYGYGIYRAKRYQENDKFFFSWERYSSCD